MNTAQRNQRLLDIATAIKNGQDPDSFQLELDQLLETEMEDRDPVAEAAWQADYDQEDAQQ